MLTRLEAEAVLYGVVPEGLDGVPVGVGSLGAEGGDDLLLLSLMKKEVEENKRKKMGER